VNAHQATAHHAAGAGPAPAIVGLLVIVILVLRRTRGQPLQPARLFLLPAILLGIGVLAALPAAGEAHLHAIDGAVIALDLLLSIGLGAVRGTSVLLYDQDGAPWYRYGTATVALWGVSIALRLLIGVLGAHQGASELATSAGVLFMLGLSLMTQNLVIVRRSANRPEHSPGRLVHS
jgi:hypothetical protein